MVDYAYVHIWNTQDRMPISFVKKGLKEGQKPELTGGGLIYSLGGLSYSAVSKIKKRFLDDLLKDSSLKKKIDEMQQSLSNVKDRPRLFTIHK